MLTTFSNAVTTTSVSGYQAYGPYGNKLASSGSMSTAKGFTGQYQDPTGLDYYNARYYDPVIGCFTSADTAQGNAQGMDPYAYVQGNPETLTDPTGHCDGYCIAANVIMTALEINDPVVGLTAETFVITDIVHSEYIDGVGPSLDELEAARSKGDLVGMIASGAIDLALIAVFFPGASQFLLGAAAVGGIFLTTIVAANLSQINDMIDTFWQRHPVMSLNLPSTGTGILALLVSAAEKAAQARQNNAEAINRRKRAAADAADAGYAAQHNRQASSQARPYPPGYDPLASSWPNRRYYGGEYMVRSGDTLWGIANTFYGSGSQWQSIYQANRGTIGTNPNLIIPGERLTI